MPFLCCLVELLEVQVAIVVSVQATERFDHFEQKLINFDHNLINFDHNLINFDHNLINLSGN